jgi:hypothetical protein
VSEFFEAGTELIWVIDRIAGCGRVYHSPAVSEVIDADGVLDGGTVLPGFRLPLIDVFESTTPPRKRRPR